MAMRRYGVLDAWDAEAEASVTYVPAPNHLSTYGETREAILGYVEAGEKAGVSVLSSRPGN